MTHDTCRPVTRAATFATVLALAGALAATAQVTAIGLSGVRSQHFGNEDRVGFDPQASERFAWSLAAGDFNGDGAADLASGIPYDNGITGLEIAFCGAVVVRYGLPGRGLDPGLANSFLRQTPALDPPDMGDLYGWAITACDFDADGFADLAIGVPGEDGAAGAFHAVFGGPAGLSAAGSLFWSETFIGGLSEAGDEFGHALAAGDFDGDGHADLAAGAPWEDAGGLADVGAEIVAYGALFADGFGTAAADQWTATAP